MSTRTIALFLNELMQRKRFHQYELAVALGVCHATMSRWVSGEDIPSIRSCQKLAQYSGWSVEKVLSLVGHLPEIDGGEPAEWPEFGEYARRKYPNELDEDEVAMIEGLIERRRERGLIERQRQDR